MAIHVPLSLHLGEDERSGPALNHKSGISAIPNLKKNRRLAGSGRSTKGGASWIQNVLSEPH